MTVKELIEKLEKCNHDRTVILSCDSESNNYSMLEWHNVELGRIQDGDVLQDEAKYGTPALIFYPE